MDRNKADYRAKAVSDRNDHGEWLYGQDLSHYFARDNILENEKILSADGTATPYKRHTLCVTTRRLDHAGVRIYENDVVCVKDKSGQIDGPIGIVRRRLYEGYDREALEDKYRTGFWVDWQDEEGPERRIELDYWVKETALYVIGNTIDNSVLCIPVDDTTSYVSGQSLQKTHTN